MKTSLALSSLLLLLVGCPGETKPKKKFFDRAALLAQIKALGPRLAATNTKGSSLSRHSWKSARVWGGGRKRNLLIVHAEDLTGGEVSRRLYPKPNDQFAEWWTKLRFVAVVSKLRFSDGAVTKEDTSGQSLEEKARARQNPSRDKVFRPGSMTGVYQLFDLGAEGKHLGWGAFGAKNSDEIKVESATGGQIDSQSVINDDLRKNANSAISGDLFGISQGS